MPDDENRHYNPELDPANSASPKGWFNGNAIPLWGWALVETPGVIGSIWALIAVGPIAALVVFAFWNLALFASLGVDSGGC
ncbi:hypothetical protein [Parvularcula sp. IMCC14364]|uniref:hypothetical protein n=1 Tax=Parvularcula sp. IMCC14364 TaxID=3067902 RepID=UPI002741451E|nr:hypothetical protein [Parvularcula sp. IMCC14364]